MTNFPIPNINWPTELSDNFKKKLLSIAQQSTTLKNQSLNMLYDDNAGIYYLSDGIVTVYYTCDNTNSLQGMVCGPKDWLGSFDITSNSETCLLVEKLEEVNYLFFPSHKIKKLAETEPEVFAWLYYCTAKMQPKILQSMLICAHNKEIRIVYTLLTLANYQRVLLGQQTSLHINQQQLSTITGLSRPRINEVLKKIEKDNEIVIERGKIHIIDKVALGKRLEPASLIFSDPRKIIA
ncbi:MAG: Crp/Fnr family transcriptional regulator [Psychromonas sp.]